MNKIVYEIRKNTYYDSVTLMLISKDLEKLPGVHKALVGMGTDLNKELAENLNMLTDDLKTIGPNDFFISVNVNSEIEIGDLVKEVDKMLNQKKRDSGSDYMPLNLNSALDQEAGSNLVLISVAGEYAVDEAKRALKNDLHVMLFSDNISLEDERTLKELAVEKGLLMMGPDCGTAIINNKALAFANVVNKGDIGIVGASGTGTQEVSVIIDKLGGGVSQVIGTGGRDLNREIGGLMMLQGIEALNRDDETKVIVLISKSPSKDVADKILDKVRKINKPVIIDFIGGNRELIESTGAYAGISLEDTGRKAVAISKNMEVEDFEDFSLTPDEIEEIVFKEIEKLGEEQLYFRGLYTGGTLANEAMEILAEGMGNLYSNISTLPEYSLNNIENGQGHICIDFGEDEFTRGRPHPMIDPSIRAEYLLKDANRKDIKVVLLDFVLGYGSHEDPVGEILPAIKTAKKKAEERGKYLSIIASICGTEKDPQNLLESQKRLEEAGVITMPSNAQAARLAKLVVMGKKIEVR